MIKTGIVGTTGPTTEQLITLLLEHPDVKLCWVSDAEGTAANQRVDAVFPRFMGDTDLMIAPIPDLADTDLVFLCCHDGLSLLPSQLPTDLRIIDMCPPRLCPEGFTYGVCEMNRKFMVHDCYRVACPGAQAMGIMLGVLPLARNLLLNSDIEVQSTLVDNGEEVFPALDSNCDPSSLEYVLNILQSSFKSHVVISAKREFPGGGAQGVLTRIAVKCAVSLEVLLSLYRDYYDDHNFTFVTEREPLLAHVADTNKCYIHLSKEGDVLKVSTVLNKQYKGTAGNAVHVMNLLFGLHERVALSPLIDK
ncbi:MAG: hypothetical protein IKH19_00475 [Muribaculaceae bacterium]|nr:hypothetical protein [Muribaculaceae bacterium]